MRRRRGEATAINLFSFQDIMASVIGMVFIIVLIMAMDIIDAKSAGGAGRTPATEAEVEVLSDTLNRLSSEQSQVQTDIGQTTERLHLASGNEHQALDEVRKIEATLNALYARIRQRQVEASKTENDRRRDIDRYHRTLEDIERLNRQITDTRTRIREAQSVPRLAFIIDSHAGGLTPWLLEITESRLRVASRDGASAVLEFGGGAPGDRLQRFMAWLNSQRPETHYFVLLIKPSGADLAQELGRRLKQRKFDIGIDLLPEDWEPF